MVIGVEINKLICGDNIDILSKLEKESVDLIYIDPPFFSNKQYEVVWGDEAEVRSFEDRWEGGIEHYVGWLKARVELMHELLKPSGSIYLHCDWHASAHIRIMLDRIFGEKNFRNEIIWHYRKWTSGWQQFQRNHDSIFFYSKSGDSDRTFNKLYMERAKSTQARFGSKKIVSGFNENGKRVPSQTEEEDSEGVPMDDVWDIPRVPPIKLLFPTQKPEALLERIIRASSQPGDLILDAFCGCGTACFVAHKLQRRWIGIDISPTAVKVMQERFKEVGALKDEDYIVVGFPTTLGELKKLKPFEFQNWVINEMQGKHSRSKTGDKGLDGYIPKNLYRESAGIQVKQSESIGRNVVDNFKAALEREKYKKGYIIAFSFGKGAIEEAARLKNEEEINIELIKVEDLLTKKVVLK